MKLNIIVKSDAGTLIDADCYLIKKKVPHFLNMLCAMIKAYHLKKVSVFILSMLLFCSCATMQKPQEVTILKSSDAKIQYYQEQIARYNFLIDQERKKVK